MSEHIQTTEASFLLGMAMAALYSVQDRLVQGENKEALSAINEATRKLNNLIETHVYGKEKVETSNDPA